MDVAARQILVFSALISTSSSLVAPAPCPRKTLAKLLRCRHVRWYLSPCQRLSILSGALFLRGSVRPP